MPTQHLQLKFHLPPGTRVALETNPIFAAGLKPPRAQKAATSVAASLLERDDIGVLAPGKQADIVGMAGDPIADIAATEEVDFVMKAGRIYRHQTFDVFRS
jgi:imidazolonepropionase-like amidohydrolase